jgi:hypothetical protein
MKSNKKSNKKSKKMRIKQNKKNNRTKCKKQYGGYITETVNDITNKVNDLNNVAQTGQMVASSTDPQYNQIPGDGVPDIVNESGDGNTPIGKAINNTFNSDETPDQSPQNSGDLQKYLAYIQENPNFIQSSLSNIVVKPTAYLINELGSLLNVKMNNPENLKTKLDEMADSIQDPKERNKILNYNAQVLAVYLSASKPSIDIISGIFSQEVSEILGDVVYNISASIQTSIQNMIPGLTLFNDIPLMLASIAQATTTLAQLTSTGATSTQENLQQLNKSIMNEVDVKNKLIIEQEKQADILEKQNKLVEFILEKPEIINSYIEYLNKVENENRTIDDIIPNDKNMTGGRRKKQVILERNLDKEHETIMDAIKDSLNEYNK